MGQAVGALFILFWIIIPVLQHIYDAYLYHCLGLLVFACLIAGKVEPTNGS